MAKYTQTLTRTATSEPGQPAVVSNVHMIRIDSQPVDDDPWGLVVDVLRDFVRALDTANAPAGTRVHLTGKDQAGRPQALYAEWSLPDIPDESGGMP